MDPDKMADPEPIGDLPEELIYKTVYKFQYDDVINFCETNSRYRHICRDPIFWKNKAKLDFPQFTEWIDQGLINVSSADKARNSYLYISLQEGLTNSELERITSDIHLKRLFLNDFSAEVVVNSKNKGLIKYLIHKDHRKLQDILLTILAKSDIELFEWLEKTYEQSHEVEVNFLNPDHLLYLTVGTQSIPTLEYLINMYDYTLEDYRTAIEQIHGDPYIFNPDFAERFLELVLEDDAMVKTIIETMMTQGPWGRFLQLTERFEHILTVDDFRELYYRTLEGGYDNYEDVHFLTGKIIEMGG